MKICRECKTEKPLTDFYRHSAMLDGYLNKCKDCVKSRVANHRVRNIETVRAYDRDRGRTEKRKAKSRDYQKRNPDVHRAANQRWNATNRHKKNAHLKVRRALLKGVITKSPCEVCGSSQGVEAHHSDYSKPLEVRWLCDEHHKAEHRQY